MADKYKHFSVPCDENDFSHFVIKDLVDTILELKSQYNEQNFEKVLNDFHFIKSYKKQFFKGNLIVSNNLIFDNLFRGTIFCGVIFIKSGNTLKIAEKILENLKLEKNIINENNFEKFYKLPDFIFFRKRWINLN